MRLVLELQSRDVGAAFDPEFEVFATWQILPFNANVVLGLRHDVKGCSKNGNEVLGGEVLLTEYSNDLISNKLRRQELSIA